MAGGDAVAAYGEGSFALSLYCAKTGRAISRGAVGGALGATFCRGAQRGDPLVCSSSRALELYAPQWAASGG